MTGAASDAPFFDASGVCGAGGNDFRFPPDEAYYPAGQTWYTWSSGTSHSAPVVAGATILFMEYYRKQYGEDSSPALVRATLANTAADIRGGSANDGTLLDPVPSNKQGWGRATIGTLATGTRPFLFHDQDTVLNAPDQVFRQEILVRDASQPLRVTLAWTDVPAFPGAQRTLLNDLDLRLLRGDRAWLGNVFENGASIIGGEPDRLNPIECIFLPEPEPGVYVIEIQAAALAGDTALSRASGPST